jgi:hypothetical protein
LIRNDAFIKKKFICCLIKKLKYRILILIFWDYFVRKVISDLRSGMLKSQKPISVFTKLKINPNIYFRLKKNDNFLPQLFISWLTSQPALSVLFIRLFNLNPQSL